MFRTAPYFIFALCGFMLSACNRPPAKPAVAAAEAKTGQRETLREQDSGRTLELRVGDRIEVMLSGNPTTGFNWEPAATDGAILRQIGERIYTRDSNLIGAGGKMSFCFEAVGTGKTTLRLIYHRSWEKNVPPAKTFEVTVVVK
jgi:inhibitor of cysteine peptidase